VVPPNGGHFRLRSKQSRLPSVQAPVQTVEEDAIITELPENEGSVSGVKLQKKHLQRWKKTGGLNRVLSKKLTDSLNNVMDASEHRNKRGELS